jgi:molybdate transport system substrate-binding protein
MRRRVLHWSLLLCVLLPVAASAAPPKRMVIAAAADLHHVMDRLVAVYRQAHPGVRIDVTYGSSGILRTQVRQGAPFALFFSANSAYAQALARDGLTDGPATVYALGKLVLWSASLDMKGVSVADLAQSRFGRVAIANPLHAPYGDRARQALKAAGVWHAVKPRLVYGENIAQTAQLALSGNARVGIIADALALGPDMRKGSMAPVPASMYAPLRQSFVITRQGAANPLAHDFARFVQTPRARAIFARYGFGLPDAAH